MIMRFANSVNNWLNGSYFGYGVCGKGRRTIISTGSSRGRREGEGGTHWAEQAGIEFDGGATPEIRRSGGVRSWKTNAAGECLNPSHTHHGVAEAYTQPQHILEPYRCRLVPHCLPVINLINQNFHNF